MMTMKTMTIAPAQIRRVTAAGGGIAVIQVWNSTAGVPRVRGGGGVLLGYVCIVSQAGGRSVRVCRYVCMYVCIYYNCLNA